MASYDESEWQVGKSLTDCMAYLLDHGIDCDVTFSVNFEDDPPQQISAHKFLLKARSPVFQAMFSGSLLDNSSGDINVCDMTAKTLRETIRYMYTDEVQLNGDNIMKILQSAKKYKLQTLVEKCEDYLESSIDCDNVCSILSDALEYKQNDTVCKCVNIICEKAEQVLDSLNFLQLSHAALWKIVQEPTLPNNLESKLYERSVDWAKNQGAKTDKEVRSLLGDCINHICFLTLSQTEFMRITGLSEVLTGDEKACIMYYLTGKDSFYSAKLKEMGLCILSRYENFLRVVLNECITLHLASPITESFTIQSDRPILFCGVCLYEGNKDVTFNLTVKVSLKDECLLKNIFSYASGSQDGLFRIMFDSPVQLEADKEYTVHVEVEMIKPTKPLYRRGYWKDQPSMSSLTHGGNINATLSMKTVKLAYSQNLSGHEKDSRTNVLLLAFRNMF